MIFALQCHIYSYKYIYYIFYCVYTWTYTSFINFYFMCYCILYLLYLIYIILHITYPLYLHILRDIITQCIIPERLLQAIPKILYTYFLVIDMTLNIKEKLQTAFFPQVKETLYKQQTTIYKQR